MSRHAVFRVDFNRHIGLGHLMRCLALATQLQARGLNIVWICRDPGDALHSWLHHMPGTVYFLPNNKYRLKKETLWCIDAKNTIRLLQIHDIQPHWLVVDHYELDRRWHRLLRPYTRAILHISDGMSSALDCDMLLLPMHADNINDLQRHISHNCQVIYGSHTALLHRQFTRRRPRSIQRRLQQQGAVRNVLVSFGGYDEANGTLLALRALAISGFSGSVHVILREHAPFLPDVKRFINRWLPRATIHTNAHTIAPLATEADLAIGAGGTSAWERCCLGLPSVLVTTAHNQHHVARTLHQHNAAYYVGPYNRVSVNTVAKAIHTLLQQPAKVQYVAKQAASLCDGLGAQRAALRIVPFTARDGRPVTLRRMQPDDCHLVYTWQIHPATRRYARNPSIPTYRQHKQWFFQRVHDHETVFHMIEHDSQPAGVVRLDQMNTKPTYEVSIYVAPQAMRRGIGAATLQAIRALLPHATFHAKVKRENKASRRLFMRAGYSEHGTLFMSNPQQTNDEKRVVT